MGGDLKIDAFVVALSDEVNFLGGVLADEDLVATRNEFVINEVLEGAREVGATAAVDGVEETEVGEVIFLTGF